MDFAVIKKGNKKFVYNPIVADLAKLIGAGNIVIAYEEERDATPKETKNWVDIIKKDPKPTFLLMEEKK